MTTKEQISALESRQLELRATMSESDAHALKCQKLGITFAEEYPADFAAYNAANAEFNANEGKLAELEATLMMEEEAEQFSRLNASEEEKGE